MQTSYRAVFVLMIAGAAFRFSFWHTCLVLIGYLSFEHLDQWLSKRAREKIIADETSGWETDPKDPAWENKGNLTRVKLNGDAQIIVTRLADLIRRIESQR
jgi:hypothetical protein